MASTSSSTKRILLQSNVKPLHYDVTFHLNLPSTFEYTGEAKIFVQVLKETNAIELHSLDTRLEASDISFQGQTATRIETKKDTESVLIHFDKPFTKTSDDHSECLHIKKFVAELNNKMAGFYRSPYESDDKKQRVMAITQFEPTDARRAFPCFDEPALKATFAIAVIVPKIDKESGQRWNVLGNMPVAKREPLTSDADYDIVRFDTTPKMSTYIVALVVALEKDYQCVSKMITTHKTKKQVMVRVWARRPEEGEFALDVGARILSYFGEYFGIDYPLPKLDMVAAKNFSAGAMENWGLVTYRETALLISKQSSISSRMRVAYVVAHESAHMWFGNLTTFQWWSELWLNEGFATYAGQMGVSELFPQWDMWSAFQSDYTTKALRADSMVNSHPIQVDVASSAQIGEIFDAISYRKGASVIRFVANAIGEKAFQQGLRSYLDAHQYKNATTDDLWAALSKSSSQDVKKLMDNWIKITGYPVLEIQGSGDAKDQPPFQISQKQFFYNPQATASSSNSPLWNIVTKLFIDKSNIHTLKLDQSVSQSVSVDNVDESKYFKLNYNQSGFFRVAYKSDALAKRVRTAVQDQVVPAVDRLGVVDDYFALATGGYHSTVEALKLARCFNTETDYTVVLGLCDSLSAFCSIFAQHSDGIAQALPKFKQAIFLPIFERLGWEAASDESDRVTLLRALVIAQLVSSKHAPTIEKIVKMFETALKTAGDDVAKLIDALPSDLRPTIFRTVVTHTPEHIVAIENIFKNAPAHQDKVDALKALGCNPDRKQCEALLARSLTDDIPSQDGFYVFWSIGCANSSFPTLAWEWLQENFDKLDKRFQGTSFLLARIVEYSTYRLVGEKYRDQVKAFFEKHPSPGAARTIKQSIELIEANTAWLNRDANHVEEFLK
eukprot:CAMPEP_0201545596 /NCGR_PEP_ID=MMETSP0173_2-20130828/2059_1 /ASSEMBLY_ACC=CAM_ASM_000268 /TAXON_ID=218659 /ORGANISM="Vexillifera sp., Strain DIVA3 564/2" /LENGTH=896 /DNA_ID=CAMNT_0047954029 /DNA_START=19 /DNA_END=2709 /DNA_ORIENTATION=+